MMSEIYHHSGDCRFRQHPRALRATEQTELRIWTGGTPVQSVFLRLYEGGQEIHLPAVFADGIWSVTVTAPDHPCLMWYDFVLQTDHGTLYYGVESGETAGPGQLYEQDPPAFQLTVQANDFHTPDWAKNAVMYQIFPDRFCQGDPKNISQGMAYRERMGRTTVLHQKWEEEVLYRPLEGAQHYAPIDFYGGDFAGIIKHLPRLKELGVTVLYLNPISESLSNHRYDTADYNRPDPFLGTDQDFMKLTSSAKEMGMRVILDGVYSHTGADSIYFNQAENYDSIGGWQGKESPYYRWYTFSEDGKDYKCWWGFRSLPEVDEFSADWQDFVISGENSVISNWMDKGADGLRLDVADELPDEVIALIRKHTKQKNEESFIIGEVWEDATTKQSYGCSRQYALGNGLDSVMNYPFRNGCVGYLLGHHDAVAFRRVLLTQQINYPLEMYYGLMNLLSSHDIPRIRTVLALGGEHPELSREEQAITRPSRGQNIHGGILQRLAALISFVIPGMPAIYYGDEYGMNGLKDPFNRRPLQQSDPEMERFYQQLSSLRNQNDVLRTGFAQFHATDQNLLAIHRFSAGRSNPFGQTCEGDDFLFVVNPDHTDKTCELTLFASGEGVDAVAYQRLQHKSYRHAVNLLTGEKILITKNRLSITVPSADFSGFRLTE